MIVVILTTLSAVTADWLLPVGPVTKGSDSSTLTSELPAGRLWTQTRVQVLGIGYWTRVSQSVCLLSDLTLLLWLTLTCRAASSN